MLDTPTTGTAADVLGRFLRQRAAGVWSRETLLALEGALWGLDDAGLARLRAGARCLGRGVEAIEPAAFPVA